MGETVQWLYQNMWAGLAASAAIGSIVAAIATVCRNRQALGGATRAPIQQSTPEWRSLQLACGDAKAMADLAMQRHWDDDNFLRRFRSQPCYEILSPHFSDAFRQILQRPAAHDHRHPTLADTCRKEVERLERG